jgi:hypothetical protein
MKERKVVGLIFVNVLLAIYLLARIDAIRSPASAQASETSAPLQITSSGGVVYVLNGHRLYTCQWAENLPSKGRSTVNKDQSKLKLIFSQEVGK